MYLVWKCPLKMQTELEQRKSDDQKGKDQGPEDESKKKQKDSWINLDEYADHCESEIADEARKSVP